jgi:hypothetical protein
MTIWSSVLYGYETGSPHVKEKTKLRKRNKVMFIQEEIFYSYALKLIQKILTVCSVQL